LLDFDGERKEERGKKKAKNKVMVRDNFYNGVGGTKTITFLEGFQAPNARLYGKSSRKMELYGEGRKRMFRVVTVVK
jgi:hypothetical protein